MRRGETKLTSINPLIGKLITLIWNRLCDPVLLVVALPSQERGRELIRFGTWGVYPILLLPLFFFLLLFLASVYIKHSVGMLVFGMFSLFLLLSSTARIEVMDDGIVVKRMIFGTSYWGCDEVESKVGGRILAYGGMYGGWIMPLNWRECVEAIKVHKAEAPLIRKAPSKIFPYFYFLVPLIILLMIENFVRGFELAIPPLFKATLWGVTVTFSSTAFMSTAPIKFKIDNLGRLGASLILGSLIGLPVFLLLVLL